MRLYQSNSQGTQTNRKIFPTATAAINGYAALRVAATTRAVIEPITNNVGTNFIGYCEQQVPHSAAQPWAGDPVSSSGFDVGTVGTIAAGTTPRVAAHKHRPGDLYMAQYSTDDADLISPSGASVAGVIPFAANEANLGGGYLYVVSGPGAGQFRYIASSIANTSITVTPNFTTQLDATSRLFVVRPRFDVAISLSTTGLLAGVYLIGEATSTATNGFKLHEVWIEHSSIPMTEVTPIGSSNAMDHGLQSLTRDFAAVGATTVSEHPKIYGAVSPVNPYFV